MGPFGAHNRSCHRYTGLRELWTSHLYNSSHRCSTVFICIGIQASYLRLFGRLTVLVDKQLLFLNFFLQKYPRVLVFSSKRYRNCQFKNFQLLYSDIQDLISYAKQDARIGSDSSISFLRQVNVVRIPPKTKSNFNRGSTFWKPQNPHFSLFSGMSRFLRRLY